MGKRSSVASALADLKAGDKLAESQRQEILATIPNPTFVGSIIWTSVYADRGFNIRDDASYTVPENKSLYQSLKEFGLVKRGDLMSFSRQTDGRLKVLAGHLRYTMMSEIRKDVQAERDAASPPIPTTPDNPLPFETIFGLVYEGLTSVQEHVIASDHMLRKGLSQFELAKAIGELSESNPHMTLVQLSIFFGIDKNRVQRLKQRYSMPTVFAEFRKEHSGDVGTSFLHVDQKTCENLYSAYLTDRSSGCGHRVEGANFRNAWNAFLSEPDVFKTKTLKADDPRKTSEDVLRQIQTLPTLQTTPEGHAIATALADTLAWSEGRAGSNGKAVNLQELTANVEALFVAIRDERDSLRSEVESLRSEVQSLRSEVAGLVTDYKSVAEERDAIKTEVESLRATVNSKAKMVK